MTACTICGGPNSAERVAIGKTHCMKRNCVAAWRRARNDEKGLVLINPHKQGLQWVKTSNDNLTNNGRRP